jgi:hypothetical protein
MRQLIIGFVSIAALATGGCSSKTSETSGANAGTEQAATNAAAEDHYTVRAGPVANAKISALAGTFQMLKVAAPNGIPSNGRGGACLVFAAADLGLSEMAGTSCTKNSDCESTQNGNDGKPASAYYCDGQTKSCWARPGSDLSGAETCNRPITMTAAALNPVPSTTAGPADAGTLGVKPGAKVRVLACVQATGAIPGLTGTGCGSIDGTDRIEVMGPVATIKP